MPHIFVPNIILPSLREKFKNFLAEIGEILVMIYTKNIRSTIFIISCFRVESQQHQNHSRNDNISFFFSEFTSILQCIDQAWLHFWKILKNCFEFYFSIIFKILFLLYIYIIYEWYFLYLIYLHYFWWVRMKFKYICVNMIL